MRDEAMKLEQGILDCWLTREWLNAQALGWALRRTQWWKRPGPCLPGTQELAMQQAGNTDHLESEMWPECPGTLGRKIPVCCLHNLWPTGAVWFVILSRARCRCVIGAKLMFEGWMSEWMNVSSGIGFGHWGTLRGQTGTRKALVRAVSSPESHV